MATPTPKSLLKIVGALFAVLALYYLGLAWWSTIPPKRPSNVSPNAVFLLAPPALAFLPQSKQGDWLNCRLDSQQNVDRCSMNDAAGRSEYEGVFSPSQGSAPVPDGALKIDVKATENRVQWIFFNEHMMPMVYLQNGTILLPAEDYDAAKQKLERVQQHEKH